VNLTYLSPLANHLWQSTLFAGLAGLLTLALQNNHARLRHWLWLAASCKFLIPCSLLIGLGGQVRWRIAPETRPSNLIGMMDQVSQPFTDPAVSLPLSPTAGLAGSPLPSILLGTWLCGFLGISSAWWVRWRGIRATVHAGSSIDLGLPIRAMSSPSLLEPGVFGVFRPVLLVPEGIFDRLTVAQLRAVIAHELCHVRHQDNLIAAIHMFVETTFWFHPLVWWIGKRMVEERERACDEEVLRLGSEPQTYAEGILNVCKLYVESPLVWFSGISGADLKMRIADIMTRRIGHNISLGKRILLAAAGLASVAAPIVIGVLHVPPSRAQSQAAAPPRFEVASVKLAGTDMRLWTALKRSGGRINWTANRITFVLYAYPKYNSRLSGIEPDNDYYTIDAETEPTATDEQIRLMFQTLLADRFKLAIQYETQQRPIYSLALGKNGPKFRGLKADEKASALPAFLKNMGDRFPEGRVVSFSNNGHVLVGRRVTMAQLCQELMSELHASVQDKTGLEGDYDIDLRFVPDDLSSSAQVDGPSIFTAMQDQLGLKLEKQLGPVEILVVDHMEKKPTEN
jgi:bla regulator protein blaR1